jgi:hypothetical protein
VIFNYGFIEVQIEEEVHYISEYDMNDSGEVEGYTTSPDATDAIQFNLNGALRTVERILQYINDGRVGTDAPTSCRIVNVSTAAG